MVDDGFGKVAQVFGYMASLALLGVAGMVTYDTGLGLILEWFYSCRILSRKARNKV